MNECGWEERITLAEWVAIGRRRWAVRGYCAAHDVTPLSLAEQTEVAAGVYPCLPSLRVRLDEIDYEETE